MQNSEVTYRIHRNGGGVVPIPTTGDVRAWLTDHIRKIPTPCITLLKEWDPIGSWVADEYNEGQDEDPIIRSDGAMANPERVAGEIMELMI